MTSPDLLCRGRTRIVCRSSIHSRRDCSTSSCRLRISAEVPFCPRDETVRSRRQNKAVRLKVKQSQIRLEFAVENLRQSGNQEEIPTKFRKDPRGLSLKSTRARTGRRQAFGKSSRVRGRQDFRKIFRHTRSRGTFVSLHGTESFRTAFSRARERAGVA